jgi:uncharacterized membrane protein
MLALDLSFVPVLLAAGWFTPETPEEIVGSAVFLFSLGLVVQTLGSAATTFAVKSLYFGERVSLLSVFSRGWKRVVPLLFTQILGGGLALAGFLLLIVPGIYLGLAFLILGPVVVLENLSQARALSRSHSLMGGHFFRGANLVLCFFGFLFLANTASGLFSGATPEFAELINLGVSAVGTGYFIAVIVIFYFDLRCRKEEYQGEELSSEAGEIHRPDPID